MTEPSDPTGVPGQVLAVFAGGASGAVARYGLGLWLGAVEGIPLATVVANLGGSAILGFLAGVAQGRRRGLVWALLGIGFSGAFTTFSTFAFEALTLAEQQGALVAGLYAAGSVIGGLVIADRARQWGLQC